mgnify:CR=1 FL=1
MWGLGVLVLMLAACGSTAAPSATTAPSSTGAPSAAMSPAASVPAADAGASKLPAASPPTPQPGAGQAVTVTKVIDGDTIDTTAGRVRFAGIDTPERGECNFGPASSYLKARIAEVGNSVVLVPAGDDDTDRYGRLIRYVDTPDGQDLGQLMLSSGLARSRYDSRDGYGAHPREAVYIAADAGAAAPSCE